MLKKWRVESAFLKKLYFRWRERALDVSSYVTWVPVTMYDQPSVVDRYDTEMLKHGVELSTLKASIDLEFVDMIEALGIKSVLDLGCGAGAFYHVLKSKYPEITYVGYDISDFQVERARLRHGPQFAVRNISEITTEEFSHYDAIHSYSVLSFMSPTEQIEILKKIVKSGAKILTETGTTRQDFRYCPRSQFKNFSKINIDGQALLTSVSFPYEDEIVAAVGGSEHRLSFVDRPYARGDLLNGSGRAGAALADLTRLRKMKKGLRYRPPPGRTDILRWARIAPTAWERQRHRDYGSLAPEDVHAELIGMLR